MNPSTPVPQSEMTLFAELMARCREDNKVALVRTVHKGTGKDVTIVCFHDETIESHTLRPVALLIDLDEADNYYGPEEAEQDINRPNIN